jgi:hypothetical protein
MRSPLATVGDSIIASVCGEPPVGQRPKDWVIDAKQFDHADEVVRKLISDAAE